MTALHKDISELDKGYVLSFSRFNILVHAIDVIVLPDSKFCINELYIRFCEGVTAPKVDINEDKRICMMKGRRC